MMNKKQFGQFWAQLEMSLGHCAERKVVTIPDEVQWEIAKSDGVEHVTEIHRTWS
ncbi:MAG: hypothetical protein HY038_13055 [Nitrospirae bacterium]|nr:hypothetical protein [Nitrospirota bacterium]